MFHMKHKLWLNIYVVGQIYSMKAQNVAASGNGDDYGDGDNDGDGDGTIAL